MEEKQAKNGGFTPTIGQQKAIVNTGHNILVSASAGSGKTKVLIERIIRKIVLQGMSVENLLVVTFTEAAAKEMKERLIKALQEKLQELNQNPKTGAANLQRHLQQQLMSVNTADISTLHSFCMRLIRSYYYLLDLDPNFRLLADETERILLRYDVWEELLEGYYQQLEDVLTGKQTDPKIVSDAKNFEKIIQIFGKDRSDEGVSQVIMKVDEFASANAQPTEWLAHLAKLYDCQATQDFTETKLWQGYLQPLIFQRLQAIVGILEKRNTLYQEKLKPLLDDLWVNGVDPELKDFEKKQARNLAKYEEKKLTQLTELDTFKEIMQECQQTCDFDSLKNKLTTFNLSGKPVLKKYSSPTVPNDLTTPAAKINKEMKALHEQAKDAIKKLQNDYFYLDSQELIELLLNSSDVVKRLAQIVVEFRQAYQREKKRRHLLDFNDLEHFALEIVSNQSPEGKQVVELLREKYQEIMVDEYQDTNGVQEALLTQLASQNMFMVGDIKQSIYRFRQANPQLFNAKLQSYQNLDVNDVFNPDFLGENILLQENFRSVANVTEFTNLIFEQLMDKKLGEIDYDQDAKLKAANLSYPKQLATIPTEILIYESQLPDDEQETQDFTIDTKEQGQILLVCQRIKELLKGQDNLIYDKKTKQLRPIKYSDIAILASTHGDSLLITEEFRNQGIPVNVDNANNYFQTTEIQIMMSLLEIIDNPHQDISLVAVLRSPMYGFDENELSYLRIQTKQGDFYTALTNFKADETLEFEVQLQCKQQRFLDDLALFRETAHKDELAVLIWQIYQQTGFLDYVAGMPGGKKRQANLHALYNRATEYEKMSFKGIFQFVRFIKKMQAKDNDLAQINLTGGEDAVTFMTIHKSKGLEFPIVFLINTKKQFNLQEIVRGNYLLDEQLGFGLNYLKEIEVEQTKVKAKIKTPILTLIGEESLNKSLAEEMRKLYVALTRAEQRLFIVGQYRDLATCLQTWSKALDASDMTLPLSLRKSTQACYLDWIGNCLVRTEGFIDKVIYRNQGVQKVNDMDALVTDIANFADGTKISTDVPFKVEIWSKDYLQQQLEICEMPKQSIDEWLKMQELQTDFDGSALQDLLEYRYPHELLTKISAYQAVSDIKRLIDDPDNENMPQFDTQETALSNNSRLQYIGEYALPEFMQQSIEVSAAQIGTATHLLFQKLDLQGEINEQKIKDLLDEVLQAGLLTTEVAQLIDVKGIVAFYQTSLGQKILQSQASLRREEPISLLYPLNQLFNGQLDLQEEALLVHGIIDGYFIDENDEIILFDYKTDNYFVGREHKLKQLYQGQLELYAQALENILHKKVAHKYLYLVKAQMVLEI